MGNWEWDGQWSMDRVGWHAESCVYLCENTNSLLCDSFEIQDSKGDFEMAAKACYPTGELLIPKT